MISRRQLIMGTGIGASSIFTGCKPRLSTTNRTTAPVNRQQLFSNELPRSGIDFSITHTPHTRLDILQTIGHGCAFIDYDNDDWLDILLVSNEGPRLFRNNRDGTFSDVTGTAFPTVEPGRHFLGCSVADFDQDGYQDVLLTGYGSIAVYHNRGNGTFEDVTGNIGLKARSASDWTTSVGWAYLDGGDRLSAYIGRYVNFNQGRDSLCRFRGIDGSIVMQACGPTHYAAQRGSLFTFVNGRFVDETTARGLNNAHGNCLGVMFCDYDNDGRQDLFLANDQKPAQLYSNTGDGMFNDVAERVGVAYGADGQLFSGMGVYWADYDNDGMFDLVVSNFAQQPKSLFHNRGGQYFSDESYRSGIGASSIANLTFGAVFLDYDNDGWQDLLFSNGHVQSQIDQIDPTQSFRQSLKLYHNQRNKTFEDVSGIVGSDFNKPIVGRGMAVGDFNRDGLLDVLVANEDGSPMLLCNNSQLNNNWISVRCRHKQPLTDAIGARLRISMGNGIRVGEMRASGTYLSTDSPWVHFGLGRRTNVERLTIEWPNGRQTEHRNLPANRRYAITPNSITDN